MLTVDTLAPRQLEQLRGTVRDDVSNMVDSQQKFSSRTQREMGETKKMVKKVEGMTKKVELFPYNLKSSSDLVFTSILNEYSCENIRSLECCSSRLLQISCILAFRWRRRCW